MVDRNRIAKRLRWTFCVSALLLTACGESEPPEIKPPEEFLETALVYGKDRDPICFRMQQLAFWLLWTRGNAVSWREVDADTWELTSAPPDEQGAPDLMRRSRHLFRKQGELIYLVEYDRYSEGQIISSGGEDARLLYEYLRLMMGAPSIQQIEGCTNRFFRVRQR